MSTKEITKNNFNEEVEKANKPVLVEFWAPWCGYCKRLSPALDQVAKEYEDKLPVGKINIDEQPELTARFEIETIPTLIIFKDGEAVDSVIAPQSRAQVTDWLKTNDVL
ncbi:thioredoxin [Anaerovorax odorimutans]|uniref:Thioredoxin n=1 Tax=Anaerovorax odorimutans TaxID=109327 RepID=A0ABT1RPR1_9FIRM|nr:thioredoxin [Anaerovorax odorimutans]MCQ4637163.1 thioredoxin [Anaerovorax odorimutans]